MITSNVSIIIRTLNEGRYLRQLLEGIVNQNTSFGVEVVLIDSGSTDDTLKIAEDFDCKVLHISREDFSFGRSLNRACEAAEGAIYVLVSGHCIPYDQSWLQNLVAPIAEGRIEYSYGRQLGGPQTYWSEHQIFRKYFPTTSAIPQQGFYCNNANSAISAKTWARYRFNEELTGLEDMDLAKRLVGDKGRIGYVSNSIVLHLHHENWRQVRRRFEREALALQQICPEVILRRRDWLRYLITGILRDTVSGLPLTLRPQLFLQVFLYRYNQYQGSYRGNRLHKKLSSEIRETYFYPTKSKGHPLTSSINR